MGYPIPESSNRKRFEVFYQFDEGDVLSPLGSLDVLPPMRSPNVLPPLGSDDVPSPSGSSIPDLVSDDALSPLGSYLPDLVYVDALPPSRTSPEFTVTPVRIPPLFERLFERGSSVVRIGNPPWSVFSTSFMEISRRIAAEKKEKSEEDPMR